MSRPRAKKTGLRRTGVAKSQVPPEEMEVPEEFVGVIPSNYYCRAWNKKRQKYCKARAGQQTDHIGEGRCWMHGGNNPSKHRRYSTITSSRLKELLEKYDNDPDPLDLFPELALLRALVVDYVERHEEVTEALLAWHYSFSDDYRNKVRIAREDYYEEHNTLDGFLPPEPIPDKPRKVMDLIEASKLLDRIGAMVERIEKISAMDALSPQELTMLMREMGRVVEKANEIADPATRLRQIKDGWLTIRLRTTTDNDPKKLLAS